MDLKRLVASSCRQRILETLSSLRETHLMDLVRRVNSTYTQVNRNLQILERERIVKIRFYGRMRMISLNRKNPKTDTMLKVLKMLRNAEAKMWVKPGEDRNNVARRQEAN